MDFISTFDMFKIGLGPSSSHTMGPWAAARRFLKAMRKEGTLDRVARVRVDLYGSLAKTGRGHGTDLAVILGLCDWDPTTCDPGAVHEEVTRVRAGRTLPLAGSRPIPFDREDVAFHMDVTLPFHPNALTFAATLEDGSARSETYYSIGGGFVVQEGEDAAARAVAPGVPFPVETAADLLRACREGGLTIPEVVLRDELAIRDEEAVRRGLARIWSAMRGSAFRGAYAEGILPGGLEVVRRAPRLNRSLLGDRAEAASRSPEAWVEAVRASAGGFEATLKWVSCFALAVNEENAAFGRVVTAPTNGAAGVIPAVLLYRACFHEGGGEAVEPFLLTAGAVGAVFKKRATISAALGGCQAEIGVSSAMAAAGLAQTLGGTAEQALMAAEIAMEHHLGLTCDPVGGLVQVPCIERNTMGAVKAITAAQLALEGDPARAKVSLDAVIRSMWETALDMSAKYKETSEGGLAVQIPVNVVEC
ncbi:L-serine dehydratase 1 [Aquisphaera giovannonii]|uniref:L-serine dehydratase n=1 Tax=Aquisphaera giovannonii TaxID=406548 RepID=A0A5B9W595_9BACT|nr:L-serine ammonia-lyase [Aquisphaera giovannonii]QEH35354.1 L-serine dehydratase 1 [Aquisphaera giovannonii]